MERREAGMSGGWVKLSFFILPNSQAMIETGIKTTLSLACTALGMEKTGPLLQEQERNDGDLQIIIIRVQEDT